MKMQTKTSKPKKEKKLLLNLIDGERKRHRVALVTEEGEWNQHEPNSGMARMFVVMLLVHVVLIGGIIIYDFMDDDEKSPQIAATQAARSMGSASGLPEASPEIVSAQAKAAADTEQFDNYEMRSGDSLKTIATKFGTTEEEINRLNMIDKGLQIGPGTMLRVPRQTVPSAIPVDAKTLMPKTAAEETPKAIPVQQQPPAPIKEPSEAVKPADAPASLSAATTPMSLTAPGEPASAAESLAASADLPAIAQVPAKTTTVLPPPPRPVVAALLQPSAPKAADPPKQAERAVPTPPAKSGPLPPPAQKLKKAAGPPPPPPKSAEPARRTADAPPKAATPKATAVRTHTLQPGETLYRLSSRYGVSVPAIQKANNIKNPNALREGTKLVIPAN